MSLVKVDDILKDARKRKYGIPCFLGGNVEMILGATRAAEDVKSPLILCFNEAITPDIPMEMSMPLLVDAAKRSTAPVATILDHGTTFDSCIRAIRYGSSSIMFDGSNLPYEENLKITQELRQITFAVDVALEAELGSIGGSVLEYGESTGSESGYTDPERAVEFVARTNVDVLAISFGNVHGRYHGGGTLDLDLVRSIRSKIDIPLVMHGGSGLSDQTYVDIIDAGISKINYYTAISRGAAYAVFDAVKQNGDDIIYHTIISKSIEYFYNESKRVLQLFGCAGKA